MLLHLQPTELARLFLINNRSHNDDSRANTKRVSSLFSYQFLFGLALSTLLCLPAKAYDAGYYRDYSEAQTVCNQYASYVSGFCRAIWNYGPGYGTFEVWLTYSQPKLGDFLYPHSACPSDQLFQGPYPGSCQPLPDAIYKPSNTIPWYPELVEAESAMRTAQPSADKLQLSSQSGNVYNYSVPDVAPNVSPWAYRSHNCHFGPLGPYASEPEAEQIGLAQFAAGAWVESRSE